MLSAQNIQGDVLAWEVTKDNAPFYCPMCKDGVIVKKGRVKVHHFAHIPPSDCAYGTGESEEHRKAKVEIYKALEMHPDITKLKLERPLGEVRPDISFFFQGTPVAIEVQISTLSLDTIDRRTRAYEKKGIYLLWTSPYRYTSLEFSRLAKQEQYNPLLWEKYIHTMYFGKVYYWVSGETLQPVHFDEHKIHVPLKGWYDSDGEDHTAGGYDRYSKRYRTPRFLDEVNITSFSPIIRKPWSSKTLTIPAAKLWTQSTQ